METTELGNIARESKGSAILPFDSSEPVLNPHPSSETYQETAPAKPPETQVSEKTVGKKYKGHIVLIDDDVDVTSLLKALLQKENYKITSFTRATEGLEALQSSQGLNVIQNPKAVDLVITDMKMPELNGLSFITQFRSIQPRIPVLLMTAFGCIDTAIEAIQRGAYQYIVKPFNFVELCITIERAIRSKQIEDENVDLRHEIELDRNRGRLVGKSRAMQEVIEIIHKVAQSDSNVLITGESGTGKDLVARAIHDRSLRRTGPFMAINCAAIPEALLESELFGHAKGSFTGATQRRVGLFEESSGGTILLDEIGDMPLPLQVKLLRVLQEKKVKPVGENEAKTIDVRIIAATHQNLPSLIREMKFREDLYYRLSVVPISIPPLRERPEDIPELAQHFLKRISQDQGARGTSFTTAAIKKLCNMKWEGNVRELENVIERAAIFCTNQRIDEQDISVTSPGMTRSPQMPSGVHFDPTHLITLEELERQYVDFILKQCGGRKDHASKILGIDRKTLYRKERRFGLTPQAPREVELTDFFS